MLHEILQRTDDISASIISKTTKDKYLRVEIHTWIQNKGLLFSSKCKSSLTSTFVFSYYFLSLGFIMH